MKRESVIKIEVKRCVGGFQVVSTVVEEDGIGGCPCIAGTQEYLAATVDDVAAMVKGLLSR